MQPFKLLAVDGLNVVRRIYEANLAPDSEQKAQGAMKSALGSLRRAWDEHRPTHALLAFDYGGTTWRHAIYPEYRQNRKPMPAPLSDALPDFLNSLTSMGLCVRRIQGVEADDTLGTVATKAAAHDISCVVLSTDKDLVQLVSPCVQVRDHFKLEWRTAEWCVSKFGVRPSQVADFLALTGDAIDGIPGVKGIGAKTAASLLGTYETLDNVLAAADTLPGKLGEKLREGKELARISRQLTELNKTVDLQLSRFADLRCPVAL